MAIVTVSQNIIKSLSYMKSFLSKPQISYVAQFVLGIILCPGKRTVSNIQRTNLFNRDISCFTRFLSESPWNHHYTKEQRLKHVSKYLKREREKTSKATVGFLIIDDTACKKDSTTKSIERLDFHYSHLEGKSVWSHSVVSSQIVSQDYSLPGEYSVYYRKKYCENNKLPFKSKVDIAVDMITNYKSIDDKTYVMMDRWYTNKKTIDACNKKGYYYIGGLKINSVIYPMGIRVSIREFASRLDPQDLRPVTVEGKRYKIFEYEGKVSRISNAKVILCWEDKYDSKVPPFVILCTDVSCDSETIMTYYRKRWGIETGYRHLKESQGFDHYQVRSMKSIQRFWELQFITYTYLEFQRKELGFSTLGDVINKERKDYLGRLIVHAYMQGHDKIPLAEVLEELNLTA
jgi:hypothetical protein